MNAVTDVIVIGAGLAGITCARALAEAGCVPIVLEKSRGLGGRMATRRSDAGEFDHGAQFVTAEGAAFAAWLSNTDGMDAWSATGFADGRQRYVGTPRMNAALKAAAEGLDIRFQTEVSALRETDDGWHVDARDFSATARFLVLAIPPVQAAKLLGGDAVEALDAVRVAPCWALMLAFDAGLETETDILRSRTGAISWAARNSSKPGRPSGETWVVHASPAWSREHLEREKEAVAPDLLGHFQDLVGPLPTPTFISAHRWRYAMTEVPLGHPFLDLGTALVGGDWALGAKCEAAFDSGLAMARALTPRLQPS